MAKAPEKPPDQGAKSPVRLGLFWGSASKPSTPTPRARRERYVKQRQAAGTTIVAGLKMPRGIDIQEYAAMSPLKVQSDKGPLNPPSKKL